MYECPRPDSKNFTRVPVPSAVASDRTRPSFKVQELNGGTCETVFAPPPRPWAPEI